MKRKLTIKRILYRLFTPFCVISVLIGLVFATAKDKNMTAYFQDIDYFIADKGFKNAASHSEFIISEFTYRNDTFLDIILSFDELMGSTWQISANYEILGDIISLDEKDMQLYIYLVNCFSNETLKEDELWEFLNVKTFAKEDFPIQTFLCDDKIQFSVWKDRYGLGKETGEFLLLGRIDNNIVVLDYLRLLVDVKDTYKNKELLSLTLVDRQIEEETKYTDVIYSFNVDRNKLSSTKSNKQENIPGYTMTINKYFSVPSEKPQLGDVSLILQYIDIFGIKAVTYNNLTEFFLDRDSDGYSYPIYDSYNFSSKFLPCIKQFTDFGYNYDYYYKLVKNAYEIFAVYGTIK